MITLDNRTSATLNVLKCCLCIGVVFIHSQIVPGAGSFYTFISPTLDAIRSGEYADNQLFATMEYVFSRSFLDKTCVPLFFLLSGYLFFHNVEDFGMDRYKGKLKTRVKSLLYPYFIANVIYMAIYAVTGLEELDFKTILSTGLVNGYPVDAPTWYLRDLMWLCLLSPLIYKCLKCNWCIYLLAVSVPWILGFHHDFIPLFTVEDSPLFFFSIGSCLAVKGCNIIDAANDRKTLYASCAIYAALLTAACVTGNATVLRISVPFSFPIWIKLASAVAGLSDYRCSEAVVSASFFIFLYHWIFARLIPWSFMRLLGDGGISCFIAYFGGAVAVIALLSATYLAIRKHAGRLSRILVGSR